MIKDPLSRKGALAVETIPARHIVHRTRDTSWFGTDHTMNLYRGCPHGCIYCDSRSACYGNHNFDTVRVKERALELVRNDLQRKIRPGIVGTGSMSDPYNPLEGQLCLTRNALSLLDAYGFGVTIATKSDLIVRDIDILTLMREHVPVLCKLTITTCDDGLAAKIEPRAPSPSRRLEAVRQLSAAGIPVCVLLMPVLPFLEDTTANVLEVAQRAAEAGARYLYPSLGMTQRDRQREWYYQELEARFPGQGLADRNRQTFGDRYWCASPQARRLWDVLTARCRKLGLLYEMKQIVSSYQSGYGDRQLSFF